jgi:hypothetical protein
MAFAAAPSNRYLAEPMAAKIVGMPDDMVTLHDRVRG